MAIKLVELIAGCWSSNPEVSLMLEFPSSSNPIKVIYE
jgi:hypothetical protein